MWPWRFYWRVDPNTVELLVALTDDLVVWFIIALFLSHFPWFIYTPLFFGLTLAFHFYLVVRPKEWLQFFTSCFLDINLLCFLTWICTGGGTAWWIFPLFGMSLLLVPAWISRLYAEDPRKAFYAHLSMVIVFDLFMFFTWMVAGQGILKYLQDRLRYIGYPWFFYPICGTAIPLIIHWCCVRYSSKDELGKTLRLWKMHLLLYIDINTMLFITWALAGGFPWFVFVHFGWGPFLGMHFYKLRRSLSKTELPSQVAPVSPQQMGVQVQYPQYTPQPQFQVPIYMASQYQFAQQTPQVVGYTVAQTPMLYPATTPSTPPSNPQL
jgi:hypothetical protein